MMRKPKNFNRVFLIEVPDGNGVKLVPVAAGIASHRSEISETSQNYYYMSGRGVCETELAGRQVVWNFSGHRVKGDRAQDYIFDELLYADPGREVICYEYDDSAQGAGANGHKSRAVVSVQDDGSGEAADRQKVSFSLYLSGEAQRGIVGKTGAGESAVYTWTPKV